MKKAIILVICLLLIYGCSKQKAEPEKPAEELNELSIYGALTDYEHENGTTKVYMNQELYNCRENVSSVVIFGKIPEADLASLNKGEKYMIVFKKINEEYEWQGGVNALGPEYCRGK
ncbi:MAG: hypothetical protein AABW87_00515 [Nanoarchaeota archaeon]